MCATCRDNQNKDTVPAKLSLVFAEMEESGLIDYTFNSHTVTHDGIQGFAGTSAALVRSTSPARWSSRPRKIVFTKRFLHIDEPW
jgi:hypothetical protein